MGIDTYAFEINYVQIMFRANSQIPTIHFDFAVQKVEPQLLEAQSLWDAEFLVAYLAFC